MTRLEAFARFLWEFVVGDDWRIAAGVAAGLGLTAVLAGAGLPAWWVLPIIAGGLLAFSVWSASGG